jgi:glutamyl-tRNA synthetase
MIEISYDKVVHSSDHFDKILKYTEQLIQQGDAYMDDTDGETVSRRVCQITILTRQISLQRRALEPSQRRDATIEENMARFKEMCSGSAEGRKWSLRAKIDYAHKNGTMRDPVIYRSVDATHHITGYVVNWRVQGPC